MLQWILSIFFTDTLVMFGSVFTQLLCNMVFDEQGYPPFYNMFCSSRPWNDPGEWTREARTLGKEAHGTWTRQRQWDRVEELHRARYAPSLERTTVVIVLNELVFYWMTLALVLYLFRKPFLHRPMSQNAVQKPSLKPQTASNADVEARWLGKTLGAGWRL